MTKNPTTCAKENSRSADQHCFVPGWEQTARWDQHNEGPSQDSSHSTERGLSRDSTQRGPSRESIERGTQLLSN
jgi:hypothetical protein